MKTTLWCKLTVATAGEGDGLTSPILSHPVSTCVSLMSRGALLDKSVTDNGMQEMVELDEVEVAHLPPSGSVAIIWNSVQLHSCALYYWLWCSFIFSPYFSILIFICPGKHFIDITVRYLRWMMWLVSLSSKIVHQIQTPIWTIHTFSGRFLIIKVKSSLERYCSWTLYLRALILSEYGLVPQST